MQQKATTYVDINLKGGKRKQLNWFCLFPNNIIYTMVRIKVVAKTIINTMIHLLFRNYS